MTSWMDTVLGAHKPKKHPILSSFKYGFTGIADAALKERNMQIHIVLSFFVIAAGFALKISKFEWIAVLIAIGGMISLELMNSAVERTVDLYTKEFHPLAKQAKDIAAGAVLFFAIISVMIGMIIFAPKIIDLLTL